MNSSTLKELDSLTGGSQTIPKTYMMNVSSDSILPETNATQKHSLTECLFGREEGNSCMVWYHWSCVGDEESQFQGAWSVSSDVKDFTVDISKCHQPAVYCFCIDEARSKFMNKKS